MIADPELKRRIDEASRKADLLSRELERLATEVKAHTGARPEQWNVIAANSRNLDRAARSLQAIMY